MLRAHAIRSTFDENLDDWIKGFILLTPTGVLTGVSSTLSDRYAKRAAAVTGATWRAHTSSSSPPTSSSSSSSHLSVQPMQALGLRRDRRTGAVKSILYVVEDKRVGQPGPWQRRPWAVAAVKEGLLVACMGEPLVESASNEERTEDDGMSRDGGGLDESEADNASDAGSARDASSLQSGKGGSKPTAAQWQLGDDDEEPSAPQLSQELTKRLVNKAEGMAEFLREELKDFKMPRICS